MVVGGAESSNLLGPLASAELYDPATATWSPTGALGTARTYHTATLLPSGKVLVVGGIQKQSLASAELYDPAMGTWTATGPLATARFKHTATLLPSGKVLVVGGYSSFYDPVATAEVYDPSTGLWTAGGRLITPRAEHSATLLRSGQVLITGGDKGNTGFAESELFDYRTGRWSATGSLAQGRLWHTATLLLSGKVLVAGGWRGTTPSGTNLGLATSAELYDPGTGRWSATGSLLTARSSHVAVLLPSGKVLVAGGGTFLDPNCEIYDPAQGNWARDGDLLGASIREATLTLLPAGCALIVGAFDVQVYAPLSESLSSSPRPLTTARDENTITLLPSGHALVVGGWSAGQALASAEIYNPASGTWRATGALAQARENHTATLLPSGKVLVAGGDSGTPNRSGGPPLASCELYDPATGTWQNTGSMREARREHTATLLSSGRVLVTGGWKETEILASAEIYDPTTGKWASVAHMNWPRVRHTATLLASGKVLVVGGNGGNVELYEPETDSWTPTGSLLIARSGHTATLLPSGKVLVAGGYGYGHLTEVEMYDPALGIWFPLNALASPRAEHDAVLLPSGKVLVVGGWNGQFLLENVEVFDPVIGWTAAGRLSDPRVRLAATVLPSGQVLVAGGDNGSQLGSAELLTPQVAWQNQSPEITTVPSTLRFGTPVEITGLRFRGGSEASTGSSSNSATNYPLIQLISLESKQSLWLTPDPRQSFWDDPMKVTISRLPATISPGWHHLRVVTAGKISEAKTVLVSCSMAITKQPEDRTARAGVTAIFTVEAQGTRTFQWQKDGVEIPGATGPSYTTPPIAGADSGTRYQVRLGNGCTTAISRAAALTVEDHKAPDANVISPSGGEYWLLSEPGASSTRLVTWSMSDDVRICQVRVSLLYSRDGGSNYREAPAGGGLPATFGSGGACAFPGPTETSLSYTVPLGPPAGAVGALYKIQVHVWDQAGLDKIVTSQNPFYIVQPNPDSVRTLILANTARMQARMGITPNQAKALDGKLREIASHPRVLGLVVDLNGVTDLSHPQTGLYAAWDADSANPDKANRVLFGCHAPLPAGCASERKGIHDLIRDLLQVYSGVKYLVLIGDDRIIPLARIADRTALLPESRYTESGGGGLTGTGTTVGQALAKNRYLSDDPLASHSPVSAAGLRGETGEQERVFLPDLAVGRLVETPEEIASTLATFISRDGILDLTELDPARGHKVLATGYDFLLDSARIVRERWKNALGVSSPHDDSLAPVDGQLLTPGWGVASVADRRRSLQAHLAGNGGAPYAISFLNGHATHYQEGVPGTNSTDIQGLESSVLYGGDRCGAPSGEPLDLAGGVVFAVGCHGGLPVAGSCAGGPDHSLDLPQTFLARGAVAYVANTGYGWGLLSGVGYSERLVEILSEEMTRGRVVVTGEAVQRAKLRYFLEAPRFDPYDEKTLMEWTFFGLPMYAVRTGIASRSAVRPEVVGGAEPAILQRFGRVSIDRQATGDAVPTTMVSGRVSSLPPFLTRLDLHFDFTAPGVYTKRNAAGDPLGAAPGCPPPPRGTPAGCYYTLNGLVERGTGVGDLPIQPYFIYDSRLSGTSQHGVLWKGGVYDQEAGWVPVVGELVSNGGGSSNHGSSPRHIMIKPKPRERPLGGDTPEDCRTSDLEVSSLVVPAGEVLKKEAADPTYSLQRRYREIDLEVFFFNNSRDGEGNCDRSGPELLPGIYGGDYHRFHNGTLEWAVPAVDDSGVWRVVVVYNDQSAAGQSRGSWNPVELREENGLWVGTLDVRGMSRLTYVVQVIDHHGNVSWLDYVADETPASGVDVDLPLTVDVDLR